MYKKIVLSGFKRFQLAAIQSFSWEPHEKIQMILGTNGSGKSSLLRTTSCYPPPPSDFFKDGVHYVEKLHNGHTYQMRSVFSSPPQYSLHKDGVELYKGTVASVQRDWVRKELGLTSDIQELLYGDIRFSRMSPKTERRQWIIKLSGANYDYALSVFQKLKEKQRDIVGTIKHYQTRLLQETKKVISPLEEAKIRDEIKELNQVLTQLLNDKPAFVDGREIQNQHHTNEQLLKETVRQFKRIESQIGDLSAFKSLEGIDFELAEKQTQTRVLLKEIELCEKEILELQKTIQKLEAVNVNSLQDIDSQLASLDQECKTLEALKPIRLHFDKPHQALESFNTISYSLLSIFETLPSDEKDQIQREGYEKLLDQKQSLTLKKEGIQRFLDELLLKIKHQEEAKEKHQLECPSCKHKFAEGYDESRYLRYVEERKLVEDTVRTLEKEEAIVLEKIEKAETYFKALRELGIIRRSFENLNPLWQYFSDIGAIKTPKSIIDQLPKIQEDIRLSMLQAELFKKKDSFFEIKKLASEQECNLLQTMKERLIEKDRIFYHIAQDQAKLQKEVLDLKLTRDSVANLLTLTDTLEQLLSQQITLYTQEIEALRSRCYNQAIQTTKLFLSEKEKALNEIEIQTALISTLQKDLQDLQDQQIAVSHAIDALSPTDGLIAKGLLGFINQLVEDMNKFIESIWLYPLEIQACETEAGENFELDYKFKMKVGDSDPISDISKGSLSQIDVVDLAFKIVARHYLGLQEEPVYLDEFGSSLDPAHRQSAFRAIGKLAEFTDIPQIFVVSHLEDCYQSLKHTDTVVLCSQNLNLPKNTIINEHVNIA